MQTMLAPVNAAVGNAVHGQLEDVQVDERIEVGGAQHTASSDTAVYSSLRDSVGSVHDNLHIF